jgi:hypothetical protein
MGAFIELTIADVSLMGVIPRAKVLVAPTSIAMSLTGAFGSTTNITLNSGVVIRVVEDYNTVKSLLAANNLA